MPSEMKRLRQRVGSAVCRGRIDRPTSTGAGIARRPHSSSGSGRSPRPGFGTATEGSTFSSGARAGRSMPSGSIVSTRGSVFRSANRGAEAAGRGEAARGSAAVGANETWTMELASPAFGSSTTCWRPGERSGSSPSSTRSLASLRRSSRASAIGRRMWSRCSNGSAGNTASRRRSGSTREPSSSLGCSICGPITAVSHSSRRPAELLLAAGRADRQRVHRKPEWEVPRRVPERPPVHEPRRCPGQNARLGVETTTRSADTARSATSRRQRSSNGHRQPARHDRDHPRKCPAGWPE